MDRLNGKGLLILFMEPFLTSKYVHFYNKGK